MALNTAVQRLAAARAAISAAGLVAREATVQAIAPLIPEGWFVQWHQSDNIYDDSNYHFDVENVWLATERVPRRTAIRRAAVPEVPQVNARSTYNRIMVTRPYSPGWPAIYDLEIDPDGEPRAFIGVGGEGVFCFDDLGYVNPDNVPELAPGLGLRHEHWEPLVATVNELTSDHDLVRAAFGSDATVNIFHDGRLELV